MGLEGPAGGRRAREVQLLLPSRCDRGGRQGRRAARAGARRLRRQRQDVRPQARPRRAGRGRLAGRRAQDREDHARGAAGGPRAQAEARLRLLQGGGYPGAPATRWGATSARGRPTPRGSPTPRSSASPRARSSSAPCSTASTARDSQLDRQRRFLVHHSDCGCRHRWPEWISIREEAGITRSMSAKGCSPDNSAMEASLEG